MFQCLRAYQVLRLVVPVAFFSQNENIQLFECMLKRQQKKVAASNIDNI